MVIFFILILFFIFSNIHSLSDISKDIIELKDLTKIKFNLDNEFVLFEYKNNMEKYFNSSINFIFDNGEKSSTKIYIYDSLDEIKRGDNGFINYLHEASLKGQNILQYHMMILFIKLNVLIISSYMIFHLNILIIYMFLIL